MLSLLVSSGATTSARKRQPASAHAARNGQPACRCDRTIGGILDMCSKDNDGSACWRTCCQACFAARDPLPHRYHNNVYHQAELAYAMVEADMPVNKLSQVFRRDLRRGLLRRNDFFLGARGTGTALHVHSAAINALVAEGSYIEALMLSMGATCCTVQPAPATHAILTSLKAGETVYQMGKLHKTV